MKELNQFFTEVVTKHKDNKTLVYWRNVCFICAYEFKWSQEDLEECEIPYLLSLLDSYCDFKKREQAEMKKSNRKR